MKKIFTILSIAALGTTAFSQELLVNPGFEAGLAPWAKGPTASYTEPALVSDAHSGTQSASYSGATATTGFYQTVPVTEGKTYVISFWYKSAGDNTDTRLWSVYKTSATGTAVYTTADATTDAFRTNNGYLPSAASWTKYTAEMPAGATATVLEVAVRAYNGATVAQFDDFSAMDKANMAVTDVKSFDKAVKMNTIVGNELRVMLPERATVNIYSAEGRLVSSNRVSNGEAINTSSMTKGTYIVTVDNGSAKVSRKVVKN